MELLTGLVLLALLLFLTRIFWVVRFTGSPLLVSDAQQRSLRTLIVLGSGIGMVGHRPFSMATITRGAVGAVATMILRWDGDKGGHTAEMMSLVGALNRQWYSPRYYIAAMTDNMSLIRAQTVESKLLDQGNQVVDKSTQKTEYCQIYRSREVGQSYITSVFTTLWAFVHAIIRVLQIQPDVILCNGPGTCLPICIAGFLLKVVGWKWVVIVYVESIARVKKLSLTGLLLYELGLTDQFFVQWPKLKLKFPYTTYVGRLM